MDGRVEHALELLAKHYNVSLPKTKVGLPKRNRKSTLGCYTTKDKTIYVLDSDTLKELSVILHEFYHHQRTSPVAQRHKGTEKYATRFAQEIIKAYRTTVIKTGENFRFRNG